MTDRESNIGTVVDKLVTDEVNVQIASVDREIASLNRVLESQPPAGSVRATAADVERRAELEGRLVAAGKDRDLLLRVRARRPTRYKQEPEAQRRPGRVGQVSRALAFLALGTMLSMLVSVQIGDHSRPPLLETLDDQLVFLGFAVALAAYLATVTENLKEAIKNESDPEKKLHHWNDLWRALVAEQMIVIVGVVAVIRSMFATALATVPWTHAVSQSYVDRALVGCLGATIFYLAWLHSRQWRP